MKPIPKRPLIPIITDLLEYSEAAKNPILFAQKKLLKYGDVCEVSFSGIKSFLIHDPEVIKEILTTQASKMKRTYFFKVLRKFLGNGLFTSDGESHKQHRKLIKPAFYPQRIEEYSSIMVGCADEETENWKSGENININEAMTRITLQVITRVMFGSGLDQLKVNEVGKNFQSALETVVRIIQNPFFVYCLINEIKIPIVRKFLRLKREMTKLIDQIISSYRQGKELNKKSLLAMLMDAKDEDTGTGMTDSQLRDEIMTFYLTGHVTISLALTWTLYLIGKHPESKQEFYQEISTKLQNRRPQSSDFSSLHFTGNMLKESLRLYPPAWTFARAPIEDVEIKGFRFPKDSVLWTVTYLLHHNEKYFHDPEKFIPERWDEETMKDIPKCAYIPFGAGNRMCIGEGFAWMEGVLILATIASKFRLDLPKDFSTNINPLITLTTTENVWMTAEKI